MVWLPNYLKKGWPLVLLTFFVLVRFGFAQQSRVFVLSTAGKWFVGKTQLDRQTLSLKPEDRANTETGGELVIDCDSSGVFVYACAKACDLKVCNGEHQRPDRSTTGRAASFLASLAPTFATALFTRERREPLQIYARDGGVPNDAVLVQDKQGVHWGGALDRVIRGHHCFRLSEIPPAASVAPRIVELDWDRGRDAEGIAQVAGLRPGLYGLEKGTPSANGCQIEAAAPTAWVLIPSIADSDRVSAEWKRYAASLEELEQEDPAESTLVTLQHMVLAGLADALTTR